QARTPLSIRRALYAGTCSPHLLPASNNRPPAPGWPHLWPTTPDYTIRTPASAAAPQAPIAPGLAQSLEPLHEADRSAYDRSVLVRSTTVRPPQTGYRWQTTCDLPIHADVPPAMPVRLRQLFPLYRRLPGNAWPMAT